MINVKVTNNDRDCKDFEFFFKNGSFRIMYANNLDLYWYCCLESNDIKNIEFEIAKDKYELYELLNKLYTNLLIGKIFNDEVGKETLDDFKTGFGDEVGNETLEELQAGLEVPIFDGKEIKWYCDDFRIEYAPYFTIRKEEDTIKIKFNKSIKEDPEHKRLGNHFRALVRLRNSGSRYRFFNNLFMTMYQELQEVNFDVQQIHIEEYLYNKKMGNKVKKLSK